MSHRDTPSGRRTAAWLDPFREVFTLSASGEVDLHGPDALRGGTLDRLVEHAVFGAAGEMSVARRVIREAAGQQGLWSASIQSLYEAMGRGEAGGFTTPALNLRGLTYDAARAAVRAMRRLDAGPVVFELARSEMEYTAQSPAEYAAVVTAAALREGATGPLFLQGDHFQVKAAKFRAGDGGRAAEFRALEDLARDAIRAGFYNIDIDASTLVVLERPGAREQQRDNFETQAHFTALIRRLQPPGVVVSVGGEIGEVGGKNSTPEELCAFMDGFRDAFARRDVSPGLSKISIQTGTTHGGVPLPDGSVARVSLDFECLRSISRIARRDYGLAGAVQHGASTLPAEAFGEFPRHEAAEVHLATEFQNLILDHPAFPRPLRDAMDTWVGQHCAAERKAGLTDAQFLYKTRKKAWGQFKEAVWRLPEEVRAAIGETLEARFAFLFEQLGIAGGRSVVDRHIRRAAVGAGDRAADPAG